MVIPYVDVNPRGNGYYTWSERKFAIATFLVGFLGMWVGMITIGVFFRGPGWNLFMPWDYWTRTRSFRWSTSTCLTRRIRSEMGAMLFGAICVLGWLVAIPGAFWQWKKDTPVMRQLACCATGSSQRSS